MSLVSRHRLLTCSPIRRLTATALPASEPKPTVPAVPPNPHSRVCSLLQTPNKNLFSIPPPRWRCHPIGRRAVPSSPRDRLFRRCGRDQATPRVHHAFWRSCPHSTQTRLGSHLASIRRSHSQPLKSEARTRLDWQQFSRFSVVGDSRADALLSGRSGRTKNNGFLTQPCLPCWTGHPHSPLRGWRLVTGHRLRCGQSAARGF